MWNTNYKIHIPNIRDPCTNSIRLGSSCGLLGRKMMSSIELWGAKKKGAKYKYKKIIWMQPWGLVWVTCREDETQAPLLVIIKHQPASSSGENRKGSQTNIFLFFALYFVIKHQHPRPEMRQEEAWQQMSFLFVERDSFCVQLKNVLQPFSWSGHFCCFILLLAFSTALPCS